MNIKQKDRDKSIINYQITLDPEEYKRDQNMAYLKDRYNYIEEGKVPSLKNLLDQFGPDFFVETIVENKENDILDLVKNDIDDEIVLEPMIVSSTVERNIPVINVTTGVKPQIEVPEIKINKAALTVPTVTKRDLEKALKNLQKENVRLVPTEAPLKKKSYLTISMKPVPDEEAQEDVFGPLSLTTLINQLRPVFGFNPNKNFKGKKVGDSFNITAAPNSPLGNREFNIVIDQVYDAEFPEIDDEFAEEISEFETLDELKEDLKKEVFNMKVDEAALEEYLLLDSFLDLYVSIDWTSKEIDEFEFDDYINSFLNSTSVNGKEDKASKSELMIYLKEDELKDLAILEKLGQEWNEEDYQAFLKNPENYGNREDSIQVKFFQEFRDSLGEEIPGINDVLDLTIKKIYLDSKIREELTKRAKEAIEEKSREEA